MRQIPHFQLVRHQLDAQMNVQVSALQQEAETIRNVIVINVEHTVCAVL